MSAAISSSPRPSATVRTMKPPGGGLMPRTIWRSRSRSSSSWMRRDTPTWRAWGMYTMYRPGSEMNDVTRAPLVPSDSLATWTRISWPRWSISSMGAAGTSRRTSASASMTSTSTPSSSASGRSGNASSAPRLAV